MRTFFQKKHQWVIAFYTFLYLIGFFLLEQRDIQEYHIIHSSIDQLIPFVEIFVIPYMLWFVFMVAAIIYFAFFNPDVKEYWQLILTLGIGMTVFLIISWLFPNMLELRPAEFGRSNIFTFMISILYKIDTPTNVFPSIHVFNSIAIGIAIVRCKALKKHNVVRIGSLVLSILIVLSTMFIKQHSVYDVTFGILMYICLYKFLYSTYTWKEWHYLRQLKRQKIASEMDK